MEVTTLIIATVTLTAVCLVLTVCLLLAIRQRKPQGMGEEAAKAIKEASKEQTDSINNNTSLLLNGYSANLDRHMTTYETRQADSAEKTLKQLGEMATEMRNSLREQRMEMEQKLENIRTGMDEKQRQSLETTEKKLEALRVEVANQLNALREENNKQLDRMRKVVDQELHENLQSKLTESFQMISDNLQKVAASMGEMQSLTTGMNDLKHVLSGVKTRGVWGEASLDNLLSDILTSDQYVVNFRPSPRSERNVVEFAVRLPGKTEGENVYLPIDSKFPHEDYERLVHAADEGDKEGMESAAKALEKRIKEEARDVHDKYVKPPRTTDFAILYVPIEGLYAEVMRRDGLTDTLRNEYHVLVAGPTTLAALLNSLQMGFKTLAVEKRSKEIWQLLSQIQRQFRIFSENLERAERQLDTAAKTLHETGEKSRKINNKLSSVQQLADYAAADDTDDTEGE